MVIKEPSSQRHQERPCGEVLGLISAPCGPASWPRVGQPPLPTPPTFFCLFRNEKAPSTSHTPPPRVRPDARLLGVFGLVICKQCSQVTRSMPRRIHGPNIMLALGTTEQGLPEQDVPGQTRTSRSTSDLARPFGIDEKSHTTLVGNLLSHHAGSSHGFTPRRIE